MSELALKLIKEAKEKRLTRLDLGNCGLIRLPNKLFEITWLEELMLCSEGWYFDFEKDEWLKFESQSSDEPNDIHKIASKISQLKNLKTLLLNGWHDIFYPWRLSDLTPLRNLTELRHLDVSDTEVRDLSPLWDLTKLTHLDISNTQVSDLIPLKNLTQLRDIRISNTQVSDLSSLKELIQLQSLDISDTQVSDLTPLNTISQLQSLYTFNIQLNDLTPLRNLIQLQSLDIRQTNVSNLEPLITIIKKGVPVIVNWNNYSHNGIMVQDCPLINPPRYIAEQGNEAILRYWQELENKETITNNQTKLIFVGNSRAGKTSLWQFLKDKTYNDQADSTHGIKTEIWDSETLGTEDNQNLAAHIWDFGGQEYYHATHRLFLADNAVYVLVWEKGSNFQGVKPETFKLDDDPNGEIEEVDLEHFPASYWFENIQYFAGKHCPVLIVQNKVDEESLKANYTEGGKNLPDCFHLSVQNAFEFQQGNQELEESNIDFQKFKLRLLKELRKNATAFKLVKYYAQVREALEAKAKDTEYIAVSELKDIALQFDETPNLENLLAYLKSFTNTVLYFPQNEMLKDRLYLNPTHISRDIYKILNKQVRENNGKFDVAHIKTRLNLTDDQEAERFVALMREFDLIFEKSRTIKGIIKRQFITPQYLPKKEDLSDDMSFLIEGYSFETAFMIQFKSFVPRSLMLRFIANNGALSNQETYWRNGIIYKSPTTQSMIKVEYDHEALTFTICVQDKSKQTIDMQNIVEQFVKLENSDDNIKISNEGKLYVDLRTIRKLQHENSRGDIYENGELIPLSKFDWLTQKIKKEEIMALTLEQLKEKVHALIQKAKTQEAMDAIDTWAYENNQKQLKDDITVLKRSLTDVKRQSNLGLLSFQEVSKEQNRLSMSTLTLLNSIIEEKVEILSNPNETRPKDRGIDAAPSPNLETRFGVLLHSIPLKMQLNNVHRCIVRVAFNKDTILKNLPSKVRNVVIKEDIRVEDVMEVTFVPSGHFDVTALNGLNQVVEQGDVTEWNFDVRPLALGRYPLTFKISIVLPKGKKEVVLTESVLVRTEATNASMEFIVSDLSPEETTNLTTTNKKKVILFITSSPNNLSVPNVGRQQRVIKEAMKDKRKEDFYEIKTIGFVQPEDLIDEIEEAQPDIIHFFMHNDTQKGLFFENGNGEETPIEPEDMAAIFEVITESKKVECVVLNACNTYTHVEAIKPYVPTIVYTNDFVPDSISEANNDTIASLFTRKFYEQIFSDKEYADALRRTNTALRLSKMPLTRLNTKRIEEIYAIAVNIVL